MLLSINTIERIVMTYTPTNWVNNQEPSINADNLNKIEDALVSLNVQTIANIDPAPDTNVMGSGILVKFGNVCQLAYTFSGDPNIASNTVLFHLPDGYQGYIDSTTPVFSTSLEGSSIIGYARYNASSNTMTYYSDIESVTGELKLSMTYLTETR
jgi:hypothetical protein